VPGLRLSWLDVFTDRPLAGNPLAVVPDADALGAAEMQAIAAELGLSETVFVLGGAERLRIFTPRSELPLAGHPVVGAAVELARLGRIASDGEHVFRTGAGDTAVTMAGGVATMTQGPFDAGVELDPMEVASLLGLAGGDVLGVPRACSTAGWPQALVRVRDRRVLRDLQPDLAAMLAFERADGVLAWCGDGGEGGARGDGRDGRALAQRFFAPRLGIDEDPATGSAAGALGALRVFEGGPPGATTIRQGEEIGRPSTIRVSVGGSPGSPGAVRVGGTAVLVMEGELRL
jgi:trans-2,3-dihydro-3-hydroxyanthranilate isomerase